MSDEAKKEGKESPEETKPTQLTDKDLGQVAGGAVAGVNSEFRSYSADKDHKLPLADVKNTVRL